MDPARCLISLPEGVGLEMVKGSAMLAALGWQQSAVAVSWAPGRLLVGLYARALRPRRSTVSWRRRPQG